MLSHMRTSMNLPDSLLEAARERARQEGRTVTSLMEEALWRLLESGRSDRDLPVLPTDGHANGRFLIDIEDKDALWDVLDTDDAR